MLVKFPDWCNYHRSISAAVAADRDNLFFHGFINYIKRISAMCHPCLNPSVVLYSSHKIAADLKCTIQYYKIACSRVRKAE